MTAESVFTNGRIVLSDEVLDHGTVHLRDGLIAAVDSSKSHLPAAIDLQGDTLIPGLVELHTDHIEQHYAPRPRVRWNPVAAVAAHDVQIAGSGITTVLDAIRVGTDYDSRMNTGDSRALVAALEEARRHDRLRADHFIHLRCEVSAEDMADALDQLIDDPHIRLLSLMDHTPGQRQFTSIDAYRIYYQGKSGLDDASFDALLARRLEEADRFSDTNRHRAVAAARARHIVVASHDDATDAHIEEALATGAGVAEFPTTEAAARAAHASGMAVVMGAPNFVRGGSHSGNIATEDVAAAGLLDILSSDYVPSSLLQAAFSLPERVETITLPEAIALVTRRPADAVGLSDRGTIADGKRADLVRVRSLTAVPDVRGVWREGQRVA